MHVCSQSINLLPWFGYKAYPTKFGPQLVDAIIERRRDFEDSQWINPLVGSNPDGITRRWYILSEVRPSYMKEVVSLGPTPCLGVFVFPSSPSLLLNFLPPYFCPFQNSTYLTLQDMFWLFLLSESMLIKCLYPSHQLQGLHSPRCSKQLVELNIGFYKVPAF